MLTAITLPASALSTASESRFCLICFLFLHGRSDDAVRLVALDVDGALGARGAQEFAGSAADAAFRVDHGDLQGAGITGIPGDHADGAGGAMAGAVVAVDLIAVDDAQRRVQDRVPDLDGGFFCGGDVMDGAGGANVRAAGALGAAVAALEGHLRLHPIAHRLGRL